MTEGDVYQFLRRFKLGVLSSLGRAGAPQSALVGIAVTPELELVFDTVKSTRKYPNLLADPRCSFVIGWEGEETVQYEGYAEELADPALKQYQQLYFSVWPDGHQRLRWPGIVYFRIRPAWIRYSDFRRDPPVIQEFAFPQDEETT
jgi:hypothetical protein